MILVLSPEYLHFKCVILLLLYKCIVHLVISRIIVSYKFPLNAKEIKPLKVICGCRFSFLLHIDRGVAWVRSMSSCSTSILLPLQVLGRQCVQDLLGVCNVRLKKIVWHCTGISFVILGGGSVQTCKKGRHLNFTEKLLIILAWWSNF